MLRKLFLISSAVFMVFLLPFKSYAAVGSTKIGIKIHIKAPQRCDFTWGDSRPNKSLRYSTCEVSSAKLSDYIQLQQESLYEGKPITTESNGRIRVFMTVQ